MVDIVLQQAGTWWLCDCSCHKHKDYSHGQKIKHLSKCCVECPDCHFYIAGNFQMHLDEHHAKVSSS